MSDQTDRDARLARRLAGLSTSASPSPTSSPPPPSGSLADRIRWKLQGAGVLPGTPPPTAQMPVTPDPNAAPSPEPPDNRDKVKLWYPTTNRGWAVSVFTALLLTLVVVVFKAVLFILEQVGHLAEEPVSYRLPGGWVWIQIAFGLLMLAILANFVVGIVRQIRQVRADPDASWRTVFTEENGWMAVVITVALFLLILPLIPGLNGLPLVWLAIRILGLVLLLWYAWWKGVSSSALREAQHDETKVYEPAFKPRRMLAAAAVVCLVVFFGSGWVFLPNGDRPNLPGPVAAAPPVNPIATCAATTAGNPAACAALWQDTVNAVYGGYMEAQRYCEQKHAYVLASPPAGKDYGACQLKLYGDGSVKRFNPDNAQAGEGLKARDQRVIQRSCTIRQALINQACDELTQKFLGSDSSKSFVP